MAMGSEAPPSYDSLFGQLKKHKAESSGMVDYSKNAISTAEKKTNSVCGIIIQIFCCATCVLALPIAEIVIGALHLKDCPAQYLLPIYLIVLGSFSLVSGGCSGGGRFAKRNQEEEGESSAKKATGFVSCLGGCVSLFLFCWFICGNVWVFKMKECNMDTFNETTTSGCFTTDAQYSHTSLYCAKLLFDFTYWETLARWIAVGVFGVVMCLFCCISCCVYCCVSTSD